MPHRVAPFFISKLGSLGFFLFPRPFEIFDKRKTLQVWNPVPSHSRVAIWYDPRKRSIIYQVVILLMVGLLGYYLISNTTANLQRQSIATGFGFLEKEASFEIGESLIPYSAADRYARALFVGVLNTLLVSFIGIVLTTILGTLIGIARLSTNWLVSRLAAVFIEVFQDIPILLQLFFWYAFFYEVLPSPRQALNPVAGVFMCNRGLIFGVPASASCASIHDLCFFSRLPGCIHFEALGAQCDRQKPAWLFLFLAYRWVFSSYFHFLPGWLEERRLT